MIDINKGGDSMSYYNVFTVREGQSLNQSKLICQVSTVAEARKKIKALEDPIRKIKAFIVKV